MRKWKVLGCVNWEMTLKAALALCLPRLALANEIYLLKGDPLPTKNIFLLLAIKASLPVKYRSFVWREKNLISGLTEDFYENKSLTDSPPRPLSGNKNLNSNLESIKKYFHTFQFRLWFEACFGWCELGFYETPKSLMTERCEELSTPRKLRNHRCLLRVELTAEICFNNYKHFDGWVKAKSAQTSNLLLLSANVNQSSTLKV